MKTLNIYTRLTEGYLQLLKNLGPSNKLDLIAKLTQSVKADIKEKNKAFEESFGAWESKEDAEELVHTLKSSRQFKRQLEEL